MHKITREYRDGYRKDMDKFIAEGKIPPHPVKEGDEIYLRVKITDPLDASNFLLTLLQKPDKIEGAETLGFDLTEVAWGGVIRLNDVKEKLSDFINNELEGRIGQ